MYIDTHSDNSSLQQADNEVIIAIVKQSKELRHPYRRRKACQDLKLPISKQAPEAHALTRDGLHNKIKHTTDEHGRHTQIEQDQQPAHARETGTGDIVPEYEFTWSRTEKTFYHALP